MLRVHSASTLGLTSENELQSQTNAVINDKLQGTVVAYLRYGGISIIKLRKVYCLVQSTSGTFFLNRRMFGIVTRKKVNFVVHFLRLSAMWSPAAQSARNNYLPVLACNFAKYSPIKKNFTGRLGN